MSNRRYHPITALVARTGAVVSAAGLLLGAWGMAAHLSPASAAATADTASVITPMDGSPSAGAPLSSGGSATPFSLKLPTGAACTGDSANGGYRVQSYMVPGSVSPATLTFGATGPIPAGTGTTFRQPLYQTTGAAYVNRQTSNADSPGGPGFIADSPAFSFAVYSPGNVPAGTYNLGIACTLGPASATQLDKYWNVQLTVTTAAADSPAGFTWTAAQTSASSTSTSSSTSSSSSSTSSSSSSSTSSTSSSSTSSTSSSSTSSSSTSSTSTTSTTMKSKSSATSSTSSSSTSTTSAPTVDPCSVATTTMPSVTSSSSSSTSSTTSTTSATTTSTTSAATDCASTTTIAAGGEMFAVSAAGLDAGAGPGGGTSATGPTSLAFTGSSPLPLLVWAFLLLIFGRMALLASRPVVVDDGGA